MHLLKTGLDHSLTYWIPLDPVAPKHSDHTRKTSKTQMQQPKIRIYDILSAGAHTHMHFITPRGIYSLLCGVTATHYLVHTLIALISQFNEEDPAFASV